MDDTLMFQPGAEFAHWLDSEDELAQVRQEFIISDPDLIYLDGNSLGRLPIATVARLQEVVQQEWGERLIRSWGESWYTKPARIGDRIGELIGAASGQVLVCDSTSNNFYKLSMAALILRKGRTKIISDDLNFPTDLYVLQGGIDLLGNSHCLHLVRSEDGIHTPLSAILDAIDENTALVTFSHPTYKSGCLYDIEAITKKAHQVGALVLWDISHAAGVLPLKLDEWDVDFAIGCTYKYLNGGPGAPAFLYVRKDMQQQAKSPIWGWWAHAHPFAFDLNFQPAESITRFLAGTPGMLSFSAIEPALDILIRVGIDAIRRKSLRLTTYLVYLFEQYLEPLGFTLGSPYDANERGSHVSLLHEEGYRITRAMLEEMKVIPDFREPNNIRLGLAPAYTTYFEVWEGIRRIRRVVEEKRYLHFENSRLAVT